MKRMISALLAMILVLSLMPVLPRQAQAASDDLQQSIEQQIRAFAQSIDQPDAVDAAATALAIHGMTMGGRDLIMDESNALTAVLFNSEVVQVGLAKAFADTLESMRLLDMRAVPGVRLSFGWYGADSTCGSYILTDSEEYPANLDWMQSNDDYTGKLNSYDNALEWMVGRSEGIAVIECIADSGSVKIYRLTITLEDKFDFSIANTSGFKQLLSGIGMVLFQEFEWRTTVSFELTSAYSYSHCSHTSGTYHWTYDPESHNMISDDSSGYAQNNASHRSFVKKTGETAHYYALDNTVRLYHDKPWVLEYTATRPTSIALAPVEFADTKTYPAICHSSNQNFQVTSKEYAMAPGENGKEDRYYAYHYVGTKLWPTFAYSYQKPHTFRLENIIAPDGSNMLYLTAIRLDTDEILFERVPLDDHSYYGGWMEETELISDSSTRLSGQDFYINFFGTQVRPFAADAYDLCIWENGIGAESGSYMETVTVAPTCTGAGYTAQVCQKCGYTEKTDYVEPLPHDYAQTMVAPTCTAEGYTSHTCQICGYSYNTDTVEKLPHSYDNFASNNDATCAHDGTKTGKCTVCGEKVTVTDEGTALHHTWADATCEQAQTCEFCGATEGEPLGHDLRFYNAKATTCENVGWDAYEKCRRCSHSTFEPLPALGHQFENHRCRRCGISDGTILPGDVNGDGEIDTTDAYLIVMYYNERADLDAARLAAADVDGNGTVDTTDAYRIILFYNELIPEF